ncbi:MAG: serine O-acetyltransferase EpsC [Stygiobacter sp.]|uniref:Serine acetyltransferase n=1 Tax=Stygiobacter electus TaxID=3032292 RepID=A0AAE3NXP6_9BACT|nr:serine O-acetyltransferase EpsC [Stygiobacter electus]MDF1611991.1 serine acetyltransferase [Stygiobacter electus]
MKLLNHNNYMHFAKEILEKRKTHFYNAPLKNESIMFLENIITFLFPHFSNKTYYYEEDIISKIQLLKRDLIDLLNLLNNHFEKDVENIATKFIEQLPDLHSILWKDAEFIFNGDPAAENIDEVILAYPGFMAILIYRISHLLYQLEVPIIPRILTEHAHQITGIDIHPGAKIDSPFFIDHGTGVVIGETTIIGKNVKIYQGVTLGALSVDKSQRKKKRHPTIEDDVIIYAQAVILGGNTIIGKNSIIGGNTWITESVPPNSIVYHKNEIRVRSTENINNNYDFII